MYIDSGTDVATSPKVQDIRERFNVLTLSPRTKNALYFVESTNQTPGHCVRVFERPVFSKMKNRRYGIESKNNLEREEIFTVTFCSLRYFDEI